MATAPTTKSDNFHAMKSETLTCPKCSDDFEMSYRFSAWELVGTRHLCPHCNSKLYVSCDYTDGAEGSGTLVVIPDD